MRFQPKGREQPASVVARLRAASTITIHSRTSRFIDVLLLPAWTRARQSRGARSSPAVEGLFPEVLAPQRVIVRPSGQLFGDTGFDDLAEKDRMVAPLERADQRALHEGGGVGENRRAGLARREGLAADRVPAAFESLKERERDRRLPLDQDVEREGAGTLDDLVRARIDLHADGHQGGLKRCLRA